MTLIGASGRRVGSTVAVVTSGALVCAIGGAALSVAVEFPSLTWRGEFTATGGACFVPRCWIHTIDPPSATITRAATAMAGVLRAKPLKNDPGPGFSVCAAIRART